MSTRGKGFTLVEAMIAVSLVLVLIVGSLAANSLATNTVVINQMRSQANFLAREGMEAVRAIRAANFTSLHRGDFHPVNTQYGWTLGDGSETIGQFTRAITIEQVQRRIGCNTPVCDIVQEGGLVDPGTFKVKVTVSWKEARSDKTYEISSIISYWR